MSDNNSVKRYELDQHARFDGASDHAAMALSENGDWVSFQDYKEQADRIEELESEIKLLSEGATIAHLRGAMDAHANRADDLWAEFKDRWEGEKKYALRQIVKYLRGGKDE
jgi:hypothetical protein